MRHRILSGALALLTITFRASLCPAQTQAAQAPAVTAPASVTIPQGHKFILQLETSIHTNSTRKGDRVEFRTAGDVVADNQVAIPARSLVRATVTKTKRAGRIAGRAEVQLRFDEICLADGTTMPLKATLVRVGTTPLDPKGGQPGIKGESGTGGSIGQVASAAGQGALIGVLSGSLKGAMYGGAAGAAISTITMILKRGPDLDLPPDTMFEARFEQPLSVPTAVSQRAGQAQRAGQYARSQATAPEPDAPPAEAPPRDEQGPTRPALSRNSRIERSQAGTETIPQPPAEKSNTEPVPSAATPPAISGGEPVPDARPVDLPPPPAVAVPPAAPDPGRERPANPAGYTLSVKVKMVLVDALVRDRAGRMMDNLSRDDFRVFEDGVEQQIQSYSRDSLPLAIAIVVDHSGSVAPYIDELRRIANRALQQLKPGDKVALFSFSSTVERLVDLTADRRQIADGIARIRGGGSTDIIDALFDATTYLARVAPDCRRAVILVSDNQPTVRPRASEGETIRMAMETETVIYSLKTSGESVPLGMRLPNLLIGLGSVHKVAQESGGEVIDVAGVGMLDAALSGVISRLKLRYALGYYPSSQAQGGAFHGIEVRLVDRMGKSGSDYFIHARRGYYSTSDQAAAQSGR